MGNRLFSKAILAFLLLVAPVMCQDTWVGPSNYSAPEKTRSRVALRTQVPGLRQSFPAAPGVRLEPLAEADFEMVGSRDGLIAVGLHRRPGKDVTGSGRWEFQVDGSPVWRVSIRSEGAAGIRIHFTHFSVGGGRVWIHNGGPANLEIVGPYTGRGLYDDGDFWSETVGSESVTIEYEPARGERPSSQIPFRVDRISHRRDWTDHAGRTPPNFAAAGCNVDVACYSEWAETAKAVGHIAFEKAEGSFVCSGTLLNTTHSSHIPYFLTADHCISDDSAARTVEAYWFYQSRECNGPAPSRSEVPRTLGARYLAGGDKDHGDFTLLRLTGVPDGAVFSGWSAADLDMNANVTGIHHPKGDYKRIAIGNNTDQFYSSRNRNAYYWVLWNTGFTEPGSSGSGLFSRPNVLVGMLSGGYEVPKGKTVCDLLPPIDIYGRFSVAYPALKDYLEDRNVPAAPTGAIGGVLSSGVTKSFSLPAIGSPQLFNAETSVFRLDVPESASKVRIEIRTTTPGADVDLHVSHGVVPQVKEGRVAADYSSENSGGDETVTIMPDSRPPLKAGTYYIALALFTEKVPVFGTITATVETGALQPGGGPVELVSGVPGKFTFDAVASPTLFTGDYSFKIKVPEGGTKLRVHALASDPSIDVDLFVRREADIDLTPEGEIIADFGSENDGGDETIEVALDSDPPLRPGTYYISLVLYASGVQVEGRVTATVDRATAPPNTGTPLTSGVPVSFTMPAIDKPSLFGGSLGYRIDVPAGMQELAITLETQPSGVDLDLFVRYGVEPDLKDGSVVADYRSTSDTGNESIKIDGRSVPPLRAGRYFIGYAAFTTGVTALVKITATLKPMQTSSAPQSALRDKPDRQPRKSSEWKQVVLQRKGTP